MKRLQSAIGLLLCLSAATAWAKVDVQFVKSEEFADIGDRISLRDGEDTLKWFTDALTTRANAVLAPGQDMKISVTDIDLAGDIRPVGRMMQMIRVIKPVYIPTLQFSYTITQEGKTVREGKADLRDLGFMDHYNRYFRDDPLHYEKPMIDKWFEAEFGKPAKPVSALK